MTIWNEDFENAGYKPYRDSLHRSDSQFYQGSWQKRFSDALGTRYFVNVDLWEFDGRRSCGLNLQFRESDEGEYVNLSRNISTIAEAENFAFRAWNFCGATYYERIA